MNARSVNFAASPVLTLRLPLWRSRLLILAFLVGFMVLGVRALYLQGWNNDFLRAKGESRYTRVIDLPADRGRILDRHGQPLAISTPVKSIWAIPQDVKFRAGQLKRLAALLELPGAEIRRRLAGAEHDFVYLKRQIDPQVAARVAKLHIAGLFQNREYRRYYPMGAVTAQLLGFTGVGDVGQEGIELAFQDWLAGKSGSQRVIRDRLGRVVEDLDPDKPAQNGKDLVLALDSRIQSLAYTELQSAVRAEHAHAGGVLVLDVFTGEVLALANVPSYNPNNLHDRSGARLRNRVLTDSFEPGSTMKPFTIGLALEEGEIRPDTVIDTGSGHFNIGHSTISDDSPNGALTVTQIIQKSSNIGTAKIALRLSPEKMWENFVKAGFGAVPRVPFPGAAAGRLRPYRTWKPIEQATMSYGYGISVSLFQLARAYSIFARDGELIPVTFLKSDTPVSGQRVFSPRTAREVRTMLEAVVGPGGTAPLAQIPGYRVAGKTGTANEHVGDGYAPHKYRASFVGFAPASRPRLIVAVTIDDPRNGHHFGGEVAAPIFARVMAGALRSLGVAPDVPMNPIQIPSDAQAGARSMKRDGVKSASWGRRAR